MNTPISRLFVVVLVMFAALVVSTSRWTIFDADALNHDHPDQNHRALVRGLRSSAARSAPTTTRCSPARSSTRDGTYTRRYPDGGLFAHAIGYSFIAARPGRPGGSSTTTS